MTEFFIDNKIIFVILHALAGGMGVGAATISDLFFFKFLRDGKIIKREIRILDLMTKFIWIVIGVIVLSGAALFLSNPEGYLVSSKFIVKMAIVGVIILNGLVMKKYLHPHLSDLDFTNTKHQMLKKIGYGAGAISIGSWYIVFILGSLRSIPLTTASGLTIYASVIIVIVYVAQQVRKHEQKKFLKTN